MPLPRVIPLPLSWAFPLDPLGCFVPLPPCPGLPTGISLSMLCFPLLCPQCSVVLQCMLTHLCFFHLCHRCRDSELCLWCFVAGIIHLLPGVLCCACLPAAPQFTGTCVVTAGTSSACSELAAGQCLGLALPTSLRHRECPGVTKPHGDFRAFGVSTCSEATWHHLWLTVPICSSYRAAVKILKKAGY